jgi:signal peptide peptidase SppA
MKILDVLTSPWAIQPEKLYEIRNIYKTHFHGEKIPWQSIKAQTGMNLGGDDEKYQVIDGIAIIPVQGPLMKGMSIMSFLFGGSSMRQIGENIKAALDDSHVTSLVLDVDSPGGTVDGTEELAELIYQSRGIKPIMAYTDGDMCSGAYWIASAADAIYISGDTTMVGSVGVVATHIDQSEWDKQMGLKWIEITSGPYKRINSSHKPLNEAGAKYLQEMVDYLGRVFTETSLIRNRKMKEKQAEDVSEARIYIGKQAMDAGLVDGVSTMPALIGKYSNPQAVIRDKVQRRLQAIKSERSIENA